MEASAAGEQKKPLGRDITLALVAMALAVFVVSNDITALTVAVPAMERDFDANVGTVQWVINAYSLIFGVLIVTGGAWATSSATGAPSSPASGSSSASR